MWHTEIFTDKPKVENSSMVYLSLSRNLTLFVLISLKIKKYINDIKNINISWMILKGINWNSLAASLHCNSNDFWKRWNSIKNIINAFYNSSNFFFYPKLNKTFAELYEAPKRKNKQNSWIVNIFGTCINVGDTHITLIFHTNLVVMDEIHILQRQCFKRKLLFKMRRKPDVRCLGKIRNEKSCRSNTYFKGFKTNLKNRTSRA